MTGSFKKVVSPTLKDMFVEQLERMILEGELAPGDKLPPEREMAQQTGVSLSIAHAGITHLAGLGLLRVEPRQGVFVADYVREGDVNTLKEVMAFTGMPLGKDMLKPISSLRQSIETGAIRLACENRTEEDLGNLRSIAKELNQPGQTDIDRLAELGFDFHHGIGLASRNMYYPMMIRTFKPFYMIFTQELAKDEHRSSWIGFIDRQLDAIEERNAEKGAQLVSESVAWWTRIYLDNVRVQDNDKDPYRFTETCNVPDREEKPDGRNAGLG